MQKWDLNITMRRFYCTFFTLLALSFLPASLKAQERIQHALKISLYPAEHRLWVEDRIKVPDKLLPEFRFLLHKDLSPSLLTRGARLVREGEVKASVPLESYKIVLPAEVTSFTMHYGGKIFHPLESYGKEYARGFRQTPGIISEEGVYLSGDTFWYPRFEQPWLSFSMEVELPGQWDGVSQGERVHHLQEKSMSKVQWDSPQTQNEIYLIAARFKSYHRLVGRVKAMVYLRSPDEQLAARYLDATAQYIPMYEKLIGPYPYDKFALVENFWETGLGMPSFTLLGQKIIRFPFILHSSYPHEILHNWWGNSVFPDYEKGNWSEGLTAYLSDHLIQEQRGTAVNYRRTSLQKYTDYVSEGKDFSLEEFTARHDSSTEAVGYGKSLMFFHMLRRHLGDRVFTRGLQDFYKENRFRAASYEDLQRSFERVSQRNLKIEFIQWIKRTGAPKLIVEETEVRKKGKDYLLTARLEQKQAGDAYLIRVPIAVTLEGEDDVFKDNVIMNKKHQDLEIRLPSRPLRFDIDPHYDLFRKLDRQEIPPALTQAFGAKEVLIILPSSVRKELQEGYRDLGRSWEQSGPDKVEMRLDNQVEKLPTDKAVVIFGWENRFLELFKTAISKYDVKIYKNRVGIGETEIPRKNHILVLTARHPENAAMAFTWVAVESVESIPGLGRKLPHYHKYSYLGFKGAEPTNIAKGSWPVLDSPMTVFVSKGTEANSKVPMGKLPASMPLAALPPVFSKAYLLETIRVLAGDELEGRGLGTKGLDQAANYIASKFKEAGLQPAGDSYGSYFQAWEEEGREPGTRVVLKNVIGIIPGRKYKSQSVVVGAHYDHLGRGWLDVRQGNSGKIHHGADDNASGIAVLIELARTLNKSLKPDRNVVFAAFTGEEAGKKGSKYYVANEKTFPVEGCIGMINLDTVGRLEKKKLLVLGAGSASEWMHILRGTGFVTGVEIEIVSEELDSSDQMSFHEAGIPAVQLFTGPHLDYHRPTDTEDKIDVDGLVKVTSVVKEVLEYLSGREEPLSSDLRAGTKGSRGLDKSSRRVSLGTLPDFSFQGQGYRLSGVVPGSPAASAGLQEGDIIVQIGGDIIHSIRDVSDSLKSLKPGDRILIIFLREEKRMTTETEVVAR